MSVVVGARDLPLYHVSGVLLASHIPLPASRIPLPAATPAITFRRAPSGTSRTISDDAWSHRDNGVSLGRDREGLVLRIPGFADFWIGDSAVTVAETGDCSDETLAQLFLDQVLPLVLHSRGRFAFHASSVAIGGRELVAFLGNTGEGKSTLASSLARSASELLFSDDCLAVEAAGSTIVAHPSYASTRLWRGAAEAIFPERTALPLASPRTTKLRAALPAASEPMPLRGLYLLDSVDAPPRITPLTRRDALIALAGHLYRLDVGDRGLLAAEFELLDTIVSLVRVARLAYRRSFADLPAVRSALLEDVG